MRTALIKYAFLCSILFGGAGHGAAYGQGGDTLKSPVSTKRFKNSVSVEAFGIGGYCTLGYHRTVFYRERHELSLDGMVGYLPAAFENGVLMPLGLTYEMKILKRKLGLKGGILEVHG